MDLVTTTNATLTAVSKALDYFKNNVAGHFTDQSLTSITKLTRAEPLTIISHDCANLEYLPDLLNNVASIYSGYFLQAVSMLTTINDIEVVRILDRLNPDRDSTGFLLGGRYANENIQNLISENYKFSLPTKSVLVAEARNNSAQNSANAKTTQNSANAKTTQNSANAKTTQNSAIIKVVSDSTSSKIAYDATNTKTIYETANLAVGKLINVSITVETDGKTKTVNVPVSVRLSPAMLNEESLTHIFTHRKMDVGMVERYHSWRAGRISFIRDMIFCQDLINEYRRAAIKDKTGTLNEIVRRVNNNRTYGLLTKNPSLATASNIYILSKETAGAIEAKVGYRFKDPKGREKILENTYAMIVAVVDPEWEQVTFYFNGIAYPSTLSVRAMKSDGKNKGPDVGDIMRSLLEGKAPSF